MIIQPPVQPKTDPSLYVEQLKEKIREINDANSQIASNQSSMNELHQGFYKLGQNVSSMEQTVDSLSKTIQDNNSGTPNLYGPPSSYAAPQPLQYPEQPQITYYPYGSQNYYQYNPNLPNTNNQVPQSGQTSNQPGGMNSNMQMNSTVQTDPNMQMNHSGLNISGLLSANNIKIVFSLILLGSIVLGVVAVVGFIGSLFKPQKTASEITQL